jgi:hypothetical protein
MQNSLLLLLIFSLVLSLQGYYFGFYRPLAVLSWLAQSTFVIATFLLIPILIYVLVTQAGAIERLESIGIRAFPGIKESVGIANGRGDNPTWVFEVQAGSDEIREFYISAENTGDWSFQGDDGINMRFSKNDQLLKIAYRDRGSSDTLIYIIEDG